MKTHKKKQSVGLSLVRALDDVVNFVLLAALLLLLLFGCYCIWDAKQVSSAARAEQYEIYKPVAEDTVSFQELQAQNEDVIGWITVYGTGIDYPLLQGEDNWIYLNTDATGSYSLSGSIYLDARNTPDFSDFNSILHGHHMADGAMFGDLEKFADADFFDSHPHGNLFVDGKDYGVTFYAYILADAYDELLYAGPMTVPEEQAALRAHISESARNFRSAGQENAEHLVLLSTCSSDRTNGRSVLVGFLSETTYPDDFAVPEKTQSAARPKPAARKAHARLPLWCWLLLLVLVLLGAVIAYRTVQKNRRN